MRILGTIIALSYAFICNSSYLKLDKTLDFKSGLYEFTYLSTYMSGDKNIDGTWKHPKKLQGIKTVSYNFVNKNLIYKGVKNAKEIYVWSDTLIGVPKAELTKYAPVPLKILDYELVGVYYPDRRFTDTFRVLYYSQKRKSIIDQLHVYTLNRINYIVLYMNEASHPFYDINKYFKIPSAKDSMYIAPSQKI